MVERVDPGQLCCAQHMVTHRERVVDSKTSMKARSMNCIVMPTYKTMQTLVQVLSVPTVNPKAGLS